MRAIDWLLGMGVVASAAGQPDAWQEVEITALVTPTVKSLHSMRIEAQGQFYTIDCDQTRRPFLCAGHVPRGTRSIRVEISASGYKKYVVNVPQLAFNRDMATANLGNVSMVKSDLAIVQVVAGDLAGSRDFELTLNNKLPRDVLIKSIRVHANNSFSPGMQCAVPIAVYNIASSLIINGGGSGRLTASGTYEETVQGKDIAVPMSAYIEWDQCRRLKSMEFSLPVSIVIPKETYSSIRIALPRTVTATASKFGKLRSDRDRRSSDLPSSITLTSGTLSQFSRFTFVLSTGEEDELDLETSYPRYP
jgi:hypothetical protein